MRTTPAERIGLPRGAPKLRVAHLAAQAHPFVSEENRRGLSEVVGRVPAAEIQLGADSCLVIPYFRATADRLEELRRKEPESYQLTELPPVMVPVERFTREARVMSLAMPGERPFPVYLIGNEELFGREPMYGQPNDLERFAFFSFAALGLLRQLGPAPDIINCHDWPGALAIPYLKWYTDTIEDPFFQATRTITTVHAFHYDGRFPCDLAREARLAWHIHLPRYAEHEGAVNLLKAALFLADRSCARSDQYIQDVIKGRLPATANFPALVAERARAGKLVGLWPDDSVWNPDREFTLARAAKFCLPLFGLYRSVVPRAFPGLEEAAPTSPAAPYQIFSPSEAVRILSPEHFTAYSKLTIPEQTQIDSLTLANGTSYLPEEPGAEKLRSILRFRETAIVCRIEEQLRSAGLGMFLLPFNSGDIDRLLSLTFPLGRLPDLEKTGVTLKKSTEIPIITAMEALPDNENASLWEHTYKLLTILQIILDAAGVSDLELQDALRGKGLVSRGRSADPLTSCTSDFRHLSGILSLLTRPKNISYFRAFIVGIILHDLGKLVDHSTHSVAGATLLDSLPQISGLLSPAELSFCRQVIRFHSLLGDTMVLLEEDPDEINQMYDIYPDEKTKDLLLSSLYLIGIIDTCSVGKRGKLSAESLREMRKIYEVAFYAQSAEELSTGLDQLGLGTEKRGQKRWHDWLRREESTPAEQRQDLDRADSALNDYCRRRAKHDLAAFSSPTASHQAEVKRKAREMARRLKKTLGTIPDVRQIFLLCHTLPDVKLRARLLIWLAEFHIRHADGLKIRGYYFAVSKNPKTKQNQLARLADLLERFDFSELNEALKPQIDSETRVARISLP